MWKVVILIIAVLCVNAHGRQYSRCELAREMANNGVPRRDLADWVCLAQRESNLNTNAVNRHNRNGSWDWGLFQINDRLWCRRDGTRSSNNMCGINCNMLLQYDQTAAIRCARRIQSSQGFQAWAAWKRYCRGRAPPVNDCFRG